MAHQGQYPLIFMTFKSVEGKKWSECFNDIKEVIAEEYVRHRYLLESACLTQRQKDIYRAIMDCSANDLAFRRSLKQLIDYLEAYHKKRTIVLIDEYDVPINKAYTNGYYKKAINFFMLYFGQGLKSNKNLEFTIITGALRIAKESIFTGFNHRIVRSFLEHDYADKFGLLSQEVEAAVCYYGYEDKLEKVKAWYNGYQSGEHKIYNPWSILNFIQNRGTFEPYWINTSSNELIAQLIQESDEVTKDEMSLLVQRHVITKELDMHISFADIGRSSVALWSFLLLSGYITFSNKRELEKKVVFDLLIPNDEIAFFYEKMIRSWFSESLKKKAYNDVLESLISGNLTKFKRVFESFALTSLSYFDTGGDEPERFYHAFVLGLLVDLIQEYEIKSNRESGTGRYDVMIIPHDKNKLGIILEFKKVDIDSNETLEIASEKALTQIQEKHYVHDMQARGVAHIVSIGIAFYGKQVLVKGL